MLWRLQLSQNDLTLPFRDIQVTVRVTYEFGTHQPQSGTEDEGGVSVGEISSQAGSIGNGSSAITEFDTIRMVV